MQEFKIFLEEYKAEKDFDSLKHDIRFTVDMLQSDKNQYRLLFTKVSDSILILMIKQIIRYIGFPVEEGIEAINTRLFTMLALEKFKERIETGLFDGAGNSLVEHKYLDILKKDLERFK